MTVRASDDDGKTWPSSRVVNPGGSAYSCLAAIGDGTIGLLYEKILRQPTFNAEGWMQLSFVKLNEGTFDR